MKKIVIIGNSASGKSTLAKRLARTEALAHLDLDTLAWKPGLPPERRSLEDSRQDITGFLEDHSDWVIEGCYADLVELVLADAGELIFLDLPIETCIENAKRRPWEPHKYESKAAQDENLAMLLDWISQYGERSDTFSRAAHQKIYESYPGQKIRITSNQ
ncbi:MAG: AAA family ATPase [Pseudomonadota bacterium]